MVEFPIKHFTRLLHAAGMCFVPDANKSLLLASNLEYGLIVAYNALNNELEWNIQMHARSFTTDGRGYMLWVGGEGIGMVSLLDNQHLGFLIKNGDVGL